MKLASLATFGVLALVACASNPPPTHTVEASAGLPPPNANGEYSPSWPTLGNGAARFISVELGPDALAHCRDVSPKFPFDSSTAYVESKDQLTALVGCLNHESMQARGVLLVGRADPRGTDTYNMALGSRRAEQIREFLVHEGLSPDRIATESEGKRDAKGNLPAYSNGFDRRVDVVVLGGEHRP
jgi:peptidoglycan-associated lipoprotein